MQFNAIKLREIMKFLFSDIYMYIFILSIILNELNDFSIRVRFRKVNCCRHIYKIRNRDESLKQIFFYYYNKYSS